MTHNVPDTIEAALAAGYKRIADLPIEIRTAIQAQDKAAKHEFDGIVNACGEGHSGPCATTNYPGGMIKVCYCNEGNQCDDCVIGPAE